MARARLLKPDFFRDEQLAELPFEARILFAGLWTIADREGRLEYRLKRIKADVFPYDDMLDVELLLKKLSKFITIYEVDDRKYIEINTFCKHQHPHPKEPESTIPGKTLSSRVITRQNIVETMAKPSESIPSESESVAESDNAKRGGSLTMVKNPTRGEMVATLPLPPQLDTQPFRDAWIDWQAHRKEIGHPLKPMGAKQQMRDFSAMGVEKSVAQIRASIKNGWQGLFEPKGNHNDNRTQEARRLIRREGEFDEGGLSIPPL